MSKGDLAMIARRVSIQVGCLLACALSLGACENKKTPAEKVGDKVEDIGDKVEDVADDTEDKIKGE